MKHAHARKYTPKPDVNGTLERVVTLATGGALAEARDTLIPLIDAHPKRDDLHHLMGLLRNELHDSDGAIQCHRNAIQLNGRVPLYHHDLGVALFAARQWQAATDAFREARTLDPAGFDTAAAMAQCQYELHCQEGFAHRQAWRLDQALHHARTAVALRPQEPLGHSLCAVLEYELGEYARSLAAHDTAASLSPSTDRAGALAAQSRARLLDLTQPMRRLAEPPADHAQRPFNAAYRNFVETGVLAEAAQSRRHALAEHPFTGEHPDGEVFQRAVTEAQRGDLTACQDLLSRWLRMEAAHNWQVLHDASGQICFAAPTADETQADAGSGVLLELTLKCSQPTLRHAAGFVLIEALRADGKQRHAGRLAEFLDPDCYHAYQRVRIKTLSSTQRVRCVVFGTCITRGLIYLLNLSEDFRRHFAIDAYVTNSANPIMRDFSVAEESITSCGLLLHVPTQWADWGNDTFYADLLAKFDSQVPRISFPYPVFHPLWPYHCNDKRNKDVSLRNAQGDKAVYPYGDSYVLGLMRAHPTETAAQITARYAATDVPETIDLQGLLQHCLKHQRAKERKTDVKIMDFVEESFTSRRLFLAVNHVSNLSLIHMANQVLGMLGLAPLPEITAARLQDLVDPQIPVHPSILRHYNIDYLTPDTRYHIDNQRNLTFEEYIEQYVLFG